MTRTLTLTQAVEQRCSGRPFLVTGPDAWNRLRLTDRIDSNLVLVYIETPDPETRQVGHWRLEFRQRGFPACPEREFYVIDLLNHHNRLSLDRKTIKTSLMEAIRKRRYNLYELVYLAREYGTAWTRRLIDEICFERWITRDSPARASAG